MDIKFFAPYLEAKKHLCLQASIIGRWIEAGSYEDRRGDGNWKKARYSVQNGDSTLWLLDFKSRSRVVRTEVSRGRRRYEPVPDIEADELPDLEKLPYADDVFGTRYDAATDTYYEVGECGLLAVRKGFSEYMDYRFSRRTGELVLPDARMLVMRLDAEEMWLMDHDQFDLEYPTIEKFRRLK